ncbi:MAG: MAPEG family protein [Gammaproteobacteria bacterium]|nr:MAG: MAPEG family protein [Gammaproteobacteria bacterium]
MKTELIYLVYVTLLTGLLWVPYVLNRLLVRGVFETVSYSAYPKPQPAWAQRLQKAHANAVENLVIFATLVLTASASSISNETVTLAAAVYFWARVVHAVSYAFAIPWVRTLGFLTGVGAQVAIAIQLLAH